MRAPLDHGAAVNRAAAIGSATAYSPLRAACLFEKKERQWRWAFC